MNKALYHEIHEGPAGAPELVLLHGWGLHSGVWKNFLPLLTPHFRVTCIDLPGFGKNVSAKNTAAKNGEAVSFSGFFEAALALAPPKAVWLGWSLGGLLALEMAARYPARVQALCMMAATPCFVQRADWQPAMQAIVFSDFSEALQENPLLTLESFLSLQCKGSVSMKSDIRFLHSVLEQGPNLATASLQAGLQVLARGDLRSKLADLKVPVQFLLGENDVLVPAALQRALKIINFDAAVTVLPKAAHVPFLSHPQICRDALLDFCRKSGVPA